MLFCVAGNDFCGVKASEGRELLCESVSSSSDDEDKARARLARMLFRQTGG